MEKKEVKMTRNEVFGLYRVLATIKVKRFEPATSLSPDAKRIVICYMLDLGKIVKAAEELQKTTIEALKPENFEELQKSKTEEGKKAFEELQKEYDKSVNEVISPYFAEEVTLMYEGITSEEFDKLSEINDLTLGTIVYLNEKLILA